MRKKNLLMCFLLVCILGISMFGKTTAYPNSRSIPITNEVFVIVSAEIIGDAIEDDEPEELPEILPDEEILEIVNATYLDIDGDGSEDDVLTDFIFRVPTGNLAFMRCDVYISLELPSTNLFYSTFRLMGVYGEVALFVDWINVATEAGDYIFFVQIDYDGKDVLGYHISGSISNSIVFDPPVEGPIGGLPT